MGRGSNKGSSKRGSNRAFQSGKKSGSKTNPPSKGKGWAGKGTSKMKKFRVSYTYAAYEGGFDIYWSGSFSKSGTWYEKWNSPTSSVHEDVWYASYMIFKGWVFWPHDHPVPLTQQEYNHLWPGLRGRPQDEESEEEEESVEEDEEQWPW